MAKIISLGFAVPEFSYTQEEVFNELGYPKRFWKIFRDSQIKKRHFSLPISKLKNLPFQEQQDYGIANGIELSKKAIINCLDGRDVKEIGQIVFSSCTVLSPGPTIGDYLVKELGLFPDTRVINNVSQGCEGGGFPGLSIAVDYVKTHKKKSLVVATELCGFTYFPEPYGKPNPRNDYQCLRGNAIFGEASSCALIGHDDDWRHPEIIDQESYTNSDYISYLGYQWENGRLRILLSKEVPKVAPLVVKPCVDAVLKRQKLKVTDIRWWVIHAAGLAVIRNIVNILNLKEEDVKLSLEVLSEFGNCSSATVGLIGKKLMKENISRGDYGIVITVGPGVRGGCTLIRFW